ncbi:MAG: NADH-quinone oxidoreductase subunit N [Candidatus Dadabacteria bacterium]|nr:NADH-quinone oxidoreductase subunit N [Candidatus Dadabacteria bacterium]
MNTQLLFESTLAILPECVLILAGLLILICAPVLKKRWAGSLFLLAVSATLFSFVLNFSRFSGESSAFSGALVIDSFSAYFNSLFLMAAFVTILFSKDHLEKRSQWLEEFYTLVLFCTSGMMILASSVELMTLFVGFEIMSIAVYILSGFRVRSANSTESGIKYLILGGFSSAVLLFGIALLYGATGSTFIEEILRNPANLSMYVCGATFVAIGVIFKIGAVPLHQWVPDIYDGAPITVTGYMSVAVKAAAFLLVLRIFVDSAMVFENYMTMAVQIVAVLTMVIGNIAAIYQKNVKKMLAYSSIAHAGFALVGVAAVLSDASVGSGNVLYYLFAYTFMNLGAFGILAYASREGDDCDTFEKISGLWRRKPAAAFALGIFMFSLAGIPPTIGFFGKYRVFLAAVEVNMTPLALIGIITSVISAYYYLKVLVCAFMRDDSYGASDSKLLSGTVIAVLATATVFFGIFPLLSWDLAAQASNVFLTTIPF